MLFRHWTLILRSNWHRNTTKTLNLGFTSQFSIHTETLGYIVHVYALGSQWAVVIQKTFNRRLASTVVRVTNHSLLTVTLVGPSRILAQSSGSAGFVQTVVDQLTATGWFSSVPWLTRANLKDGSSIVRKVYNAENDESIMTIFVRTNSRY